MKAVILAAGKGTRMRPLTEDTPKPLLPVAGKPIIDHNIEKIQDTVEEIIIVAGYEIDQFRDRYGDRDKIRIVEQEEALGTADAALQAGKFVDDKAIIMNGDDIYGESLENLTQKESAVLASEVEDPTNYGVFKTEEGEVTGIVEKPDNPPSNLANTGVYVVKHKFFELLSKVEKSDRGEYEITNALQEYFDKEEVEMVKADRWLPCSYPWQLINANEALLDEEISESEINGKVSEKAEVRGKVIIEKGAEIREFTTIEGPAIIKSGSVIGPSAYIRPGTVIEKNVEIGNSEVKNSIIREETHAAHFNYIGDSYIGRKVNIGAGSKVANLRNDSKDIEMKVKGEMYSTGRQKLGAIVGSEAKIGVNNSIKPGRKIGFKAMTDSNEKVEKNLPDNSKLKDGEIFENRH